MTVVKTISRQFYLGLPVEEKKCYVAKLKCDKVRPVRQNDENFFFLYRPVWFTGGWSDTHICVLVESKCVYTSEAFKAYRSLDAYNYFHSGKVKSILTYKKIIIPVSFRGKSRQVKFRHIPKRALHLHGLPCRCNERFEPCAAAGLSQHWANALTPTPLCVWVWTIPAAYSTERKKQSSP